jgi:DNA ligase-1
MLFKELAGYYDKLYSTSSRLGMIEIMAEVFKNAGRDEIKPIIYITQGVLAPSFEGIEFGMAEKTIEDAISLSTGISKEAVEKEYRKLGDIGLAAEEIKKRGRVKRLSESPLTVSEFYEKMLAIAKMSGKGSKEDKIKSLSYIISESTPEEAKYATKYPMNALRLGLGDATMLEALSVAFCGDRKSKDKLEAAYNLCNDLAMVGDTLARKGISAIEDFEVSLFKPVRPALAERLPTAEQVLEKMGGRAAAEQKYDGFRCQLHMGKGKVKIFSRRLEDTSEMFPDLAEAVLNEVKAESVILDGEALAYSDETEEFLPFQQTIQRKRKHGIAEKALELPLHLFVFDILFLNGKDMMKLPYKERRRAIEKLLSKGEIIKPSTMVMVSKPKELEEFFENSIENGLEGVVVKDPESSYIAGARKFSWIKMKRSYKGMLSDTVDLVVVGYYRGKGMRSKFGFGGMLCAAYNEKRDMFETVSRIGSGFTEEQMVELRKALEKEKVDEKPVRVDSLIKPDFWVYPKYVITVKADEITRSPTHTCGKEKLENGTEAGFALRFPRLAGDEAIRKDKGPEDATTTKEISEMYKNQKRVSIEEA